MTDTATAELNDANEDSRVGQYDWATFRIALTELRRHNVPVDVAANKALYLARRGALPETCNWALLASRCMMNEARRASNSRTVSLSTPIGQGTDGASLTLADVLPAHNPSGDPEYMALVRDELSRVPPRILALFTDRDRPLTNAECQRLFAFRRQARALLQRETA